MRFAYEAHCVNSQVNGGDDSGMLGIDEGESTFFCITDSWEGESVSASVFLSDAEVKRLRDYLSTLVDAQIEHGDT